MKHLLSMWGYVGTEAEGCRMKVWVGEAAVAELGLAGWQKQLPLLCWLLLAVDTVRFE